MSTSLGDLVAEHDAKAEAMGRRYAVGAVQFSLALHDAAAEPVAEGMTEAGDQR